ncbi:hypothetical protein [Microbacterium sp. NPDC087665]|uniref:hypothetical protein n=1 Tax=Microbacterium sp. NPDC087665 TaxID=3364194 RepID=UPI0038279CE4
MALLIGMTGCGEQMTDEELLDQARGVNFAFKAALAEVQMQVFDGDWKIYAYGAETWDCDNNGYEFRFQRATLPQWKLKEPTRDAAERIATWLDDNGWEAIKTQGYSGDIANIVIHAAKPDSFVARLTIDISPDPDTYDIATITADSTCQPGDLERLDAIRRPGLHTEAEHLEDVPSTEHPTAKPSFGYTPDGKRRFWDDAD